MYKILLNSKVKIDGKWEDAVVYLCLYENPDGMIWVRTKKDFYKYFDGHLIDEYSSHVCGPAKERETDDDATHPEGDLRNDTTVYSEELLESLINRGNPYSTQPINFLA